MPSMPNPTNDSESYIPQIGIYVAVAVKSDWIPDPTPDAGFGSSLSLVHEFILSSVESSRTVANALTVSPLQEVILLSSTESFVCFC